MIPQAEDWNDHVLETVEGLVLSKTNDRDYTRRHTEEERSEIPNEGDDDQRVA